MSCIAYEDRAMRLSHGSINLRLSSAAFRLFESVLQSYVFNSHLAVAVSYNLQRIR